MAEAYQASLNVLREERRRLADIRRQITDDQGFKDRDPKGWHQLAAQSRADHDELARTIAVLEGLRDGKVLLAAPDLGPWAHPSHPQPEVAA